MGVPFNLEGGSVRTGNTNSELKEGLTAKEAREEREEACAEKEFP